ncbi:MAG: hypothetical protein QMC77_08190, partial [Methanocellales archaeon]|nr:hypothetical protein [Methanocellales archaeon]
KIGMMYFTEPEGWLRYLDRVIKKYYNTIWNAGNVDVIPLVFEHGLKILRRYILGFGMAEAIIVEKA